MFSRSFSLTTAQMEFLIGIVGNGFVLTAADCNQARSIIIMKRGACSSNYN